MSEPCDDVNADRWREDDEREYTDDDNPNPRMARAFGVGDHVELGRALIADLGGADDLVFDEMHAWQYAATSGLWCRVEGAKESRIIQSYSGMPKMPDGKPLRVKASDVAGAVKLAHDQIARPDFFSDANAIAFSNGVVRLTPTGVELVPHDREHRVRAGYPFAYEHRALPHRFLAFLAGLFRDDDDRADKESFVQEFFGACVLGIAPRYQRACIGAGEGENGKSTLAEVVIGCMPAGTTTAIAPQDWGQEYRRAMFVGKHFNAVGELPEREIIASESFKAIVTGDPITGRHIREAPIMFRPRAGHYFAANRLPGTTDQTEGFWRRFVVLTFNRSFKEDPTRDPEMAAKLAAERPAIVSWFLDGAARLVRERGYTIPSSHHAALAEWRKNADQVALFLDNGFVPLDANEPDANGLAGASLYSSYAMWCSNNGHRALASNRFAERMKSLGHGAKHTRVGRIYPIKRRESEGSVKGGEGSPFTRNSWAS